MKFAILLVVGNIAGAIDAYAEDTSYKFYSASTPYSFIRSYYDWYAKELADTNATLPDDQMRVAYSVLNEKLRTRLFAMYEAQKHCNELVQPDYDPIIEASENSDSYIIDKLWKVGNKYRATLHGLEYGNYALGSDFTVEFKRIRNGWEIEDFYPYRSLDPKTSLTYILANGDWACHNPKK